MSLSTPDIMVISGMIFPAANHLTGAINPVLPTNRLASILEKGESINLVFPKMKIKHKIAADNSNIR